MPNPYAPRRRVTAAGEMAGDLERVEQRLKRLGADEEDLKGLRENWPPPPDVLAWFIGATDEELRDEIERVNQEYDYGTKTDEELAAAAAGARGVDDAELLAHIGLSVPKVTAWVDGDGDRALAVLDFETGVGGQNRSTLVEAMTRIVDAAT